MPLYEAESYVPVTDLPNPLAGPNEFDPQLDLSINQRPNISDTASAAFSQGNTLAHLSTLFSGVYEYFQDADPNYNPINKISGTEYAPYMDSFIYATDDNQLERIKSVIDKDLQDRDILARSGWIGVPALLAAGITDPIMYLLPVGRIAQTAKAGSLLSNVVVNATKNALVFGGAVSAQEYLLMQEHYTKTYGEAAKAVAVGTVLGGLFGGAGAAIGRRRVTLNVGKTEEALENIFKYGGIGEEIPGDTKFIRDWSTKQITVEREGLVGKLPGLTPNQRLATSEFPTARRIGYSLPENAIRIDGELPGFAVETIANSKHAADYTKLNRIINSGYKEYLEDQGKAGFLDRVNAFQQKGNLFDMFQEELVTAMTKGDISHIPQVEKVAKQWRPIVDKVAQELIDTDIIPVRMHAIEAVEKRLKPIERDIKNLETKLSKTKIQKSKDRLSKNLESKRESLKVIQAELEIAKARRFTVKDLDLQGTAKSWFHRMFNKQKIRNLPREFEAEIGRWISSSHGVSLQEGVDVAGQVLETITNQNYSILSNSFGISKGTFKGRSLLIPDDVLRPWLVNDPLLVMDNWLRTAYAQIELKKMYGSLDLAAEKTMIREEAKILEAANPGRAAKIRRAKDKTLKDIDVLLLRMQGLQGAQFEDGAFYSVMRTIRNFNNAVLMGGLALNTFTDIGQMVLQNGFFNTFGGITELFLKKMFDPKAYKEVVDDMEAMGIGVTAFTNNRRNLYDLGTGEPIGMRAERYSRQLADWTFKASCVSHVDGFTKRVAGYVASKRIYRNALKGSENIAANELSWMRNLGIKDADYADLANQIKKHSRTVDGLTIFNSQKWGNDVTRDVFANALKKVENVSVITPGIGDAPLIFDNPAFQLLFQYKRFAMAATQRSLIPSLQRTDAGVAAGLAVMFTGGMLGEVVRTTLRGDDPREIDMETLIGRAVKRIDMGGFAIDAFGMAGHFLGDKPYNKSAMDEILGPAAGLVNRSSVAFQGIVRGLQGEPLSKQQVHALRLSIPMQSIIGVNYILTKIENEVNQSFGNIN